MALHLNAEDFSSPGPASKSGWQTVKQVALANGVELSLVNGVVQAKESTKGVSLAKRYPGDDKSWTLAETITFVFEKGGSFAFAMKMWNEQME